jgi:hypothetical protein
MKLVLIIAALTCIIHLINTLVYSVRLSGVRTGKLATAFSLYNVVFLFATTANSIQAPLMASMVEQSINAEGSKALTYLSVEQLALLEHQVRLILGAATVGTIIGIALIPAFVVVFIRAIALFEETGSVPRMIGRAILSPRLLFSFSRQLPLPRKDSFKMLSQPSLPIPKGFLVLNGLVSGIYTTGVLSSVFAGALFPEVRMTATYLSPVVNGVATVLAAAVVDPTAAAITDQALRGERSEDDVKRMTIYLSISRVVGTVLAQLIFLPAAYIVMKVAIILYG